MAWTLLLSPDYIVLLFSILRININYIYIVINIINLFY